MYKIIFLSLISSLPLFTCDDYLEIEDNARLVVRGTATTQNNDAIDGIDVTLFDEIRILESSSLSSNGTYEFISLRSNAPSYNLVINNSTDTTLTSPVFKVFNTNVTEIIAPQIDLNPKAALALTLRRTSGTDELLNWSLTYQESSCITFIDEPLFGDEMLETESCYENIFIESSIAPEDSIEIGADYGVLLGSQAVFTYQLGDSQTTEIIIPITNTITNYDFEY